MITQTAFILFPLQNNRFSSMQGFEYKLVNLEIHGALGL